MPATWQDLIDAALNNTDPKCEHEADLDVFSEAFGLTLYGYSESFAQDMRKVWVVSWTCTDTRVGISVYLLHKEPVAVSVQFCRKCTEDLYFVSSVTERKTFDRLVEELWNDHEHTQQLDLAEIATVYHKIQSNEDLPNYRSLLKASQPGEYKCS